MRKNQWKLRAAAMAFGHLIIAATLLLISAHLLSGYESAAGLGRLAVFPPIDFPFFFYPVVAVIGAAIAIRRRSAVLLLVFQLSLVLVGLFFANRLRQQAESVAVFFVPGWTAAIAHSVAWGSYVFALAQVLVFRAKCGSPPNKQ